MKHKLACTGVTAALMALCACQGGVSEPDTAPRLTRVTLDAPQAVGLSERIQLTWRVQGAAPSAVRVQVLRAAGQDFEAVDAAVGAGSAVFQRGAAWPFDLPSAQVRVLACDAARRCVQSNPQPLRDVLLAGLVLWDRAPGHPAA